MEQLQTGMFTVGGRWGERERDVIDLESYLSLGPCSWLQPVRLFRVRLPRQGPMEKIGNFGKHQSIHTQLSSLT